MVLWAIQLEAYIRVREQENQPCFIQKVGKQYLAMVSAASFWCHQGYASEAYHCVGVINEPVKLTEQGRQEEWPQSLQSLRAAGRKVTFWPNVTNLQSGRKMING